MDSLYTISPAGKSLTAAVYRAENDLVEENRTHNVTMFGWQKDFMPRRS